MNLDTIKLYNQTKKEVRDFFQPKLTWLYYWNTTLLSELDETIPNIPYFNSLDYLSSDGNTTISVCIYCDSEDDETFTFFDITRTLEEWNNIPDYKPTE